MGLDKDAETIARLRASGAIPPEVKPGQVLDPEDYAKEGERIVYFAEMHDGKHVTRCKYHLQFEFQDGNSWRALLVKDDESPVYRDDGNECWDYFIVKVHNGNYAALAPVVSAHFPYVVFTVEVEKYKTYPMWVGQ